MEGNFEESPFLLLNSSEQKFLLDFILVGGNFKVLSEQVGLTYPTLRTRLDKIIEKLEHLQLTPEKILDAIDKGEIKPEEGIEKMKQLKVSR